MPFFAGYHLLFRLRRSAHRLKRLCAFFSDFPDIIPGQDGVIPEHCFEFEFSEPVLVDLMLFGFHQSDVVEQNGSAQLCDVRGHLDIAGRDPLDFYGGLIAFLWKFLLSGSVLFDSVALVESKEHKIDNTRFREFKLKTMLRKNDVLSKEDIGKIKEKREETL